MADRDDNRNFRTGERVMDPGEYVCEAGDRRQFGEGDEFAACPNTGNETNWRRDQEGR